MIPQRLAESLLGVGDQHSVLRALGPRNARHHGAKVKLQVLGVPRFVVVGVPQALGLGVRLDESDLLIAATGEPQIFGGLRVDRKDRDRGAVLRTHVADRGSVCDRHVGDAGPVELDKLTDHLVLPQHLSDRQNKISCGRALR